ncbi:MAG: RNA polymerase sigma factor [Actinomycetota bacterium]
MGAREDDGSDTRLAASAAAGDRRALDALLSRHADRVHAICRRILGNEQDALDATQEALIAITRGIRSFDGRSLFTTWCYRVTTNAALDEARRRARRPLPAESLPEATATAPGTADMIANRLDVDAALSTIPAEFRAAVALRDLGDLDYAEIARILDIPAGTVRSRIARGRAALADRLGNPSAPPDRPSPRSL